MISLYIEQRTWLHRLPTGFKLLFLAACSIGLMLQSSLAWNAAALALAATLYASIGGAGSRRLLELAKGLWLLLLMLGLAQFIALLMQGQPYGVALLAVSRTLAQIAALVVLADLVTATSRMQDMLNALTPLFAPLKPFGVEPKTIGLAVAMMIRSVGLLTRDWQQVRAAFKARGLARPGLRLIAPVVSRMMRRSRSIGDAMTAREITLRGRMGQRP